MMIFNEKNKQFGFTLIELVIAMGLFIVLLTIAIGGFLNILKNQRITLALMSVNNDMSLTLEQMAREIRTGFNFSEISTTEFEFVNDRNCTIRYRKNGDILEKGESLLTEGSNLTCEDKICPQSPEGMFCYFPITSNRIKILDFKFRMCGENVDGSILGVCGSGGSQYPPRINLGFEISSTDPKVKELGISYFIQTTISARQFKIQ